MGSLSIERHRRNARKAKGFLCGPCGLCVDRRAMLLTAALATIAAGAAAQVPGSVPDMLAHVANRVREYYSRAQSIVCIEKVSVQIINRNMMPDGFARVLEYELRIE